MKKRTFVSERRKNRPTDRHDVPQISHVLHTLNEAVDIFVRAKEAEGLRPRTIEEYRKHIGYFSKYLRDQIGMSDVLVNDISAEMIRGYIMYLRNEKPRYEGVVGREDGSKGLSINTINIRLRTFRAMCRFWHAEGMTEKNAMATIKNVVDDEAEEVAGLADEEIDRLLSSLDTRQYAEWRDKVLILLLLDTGLRIQEAVSLTVDRVDFRLLSVVVPSAIAKNRRNREIPLSREVARMLRQLYEESAGYFGDSPYIFHNAYGEPFTADAFRRRLNRRKGRLGLSKLSPHMFRHTFARKYLLNGGDLFTLQRILDHADIKTTRKYVQMDDADVREQHNKYSPVHRILRRK